MQVQLNVGLQIRVSFSVVYAALVSTVTLKYKEEKFIQS